jgi:fused signal recognition particle receptor
VGSSSRWPGSSDLPIRYIGIGEGIDDLQDFDAGQFIEALFAETES